MTLGYALDRISHIFHPDVEITPLPSNITMQEVDIPMRDGQHLKANLFLPANPENLSVVMCAHPYSKDVLPKKGFLMNTLPIQYRVIRMSGQVSFSEGTSWEAPDPAFWVPNGYAVINIDLRGFFRSKEAAKEKPDVISNQEALDYYDAIQWAAAQPWSDGNVGLCGVSYLCISQYKVAALNPPNLKAIIPWEGFSDLYKDAARPGGIKDQGFMKLWGETQASVHKEPLYEYMTRNETRNEFYTCKVCDFKKITVPALVCMSFSDHGLHTQGSFRFFREIGSKEKWLYTHRDGKWTRFYSQEAKALQLRFFDYFLKGKQNEMENVPKVHIEVNDTAHEFQVLEFADPVYPMETTKWQKLYLTKGGLSNSATDEVLQKHILQDSCLFKHTFDRDTIVSGPMKLQLYISSETLKDMNLFAFIKKYDTDGKLVPFEGSLGYGLDVVTKGWQRVAVRKEFPSYKEEWDCDKPFDEIQYLEPNETVKVTIALLASCTLFKKGESMELGVQGKWMNPVSPLAVICDFEPSKEAGYYNIHCSHSGDNSFLLYGILK
ncbi:hypothetical protein HDV06_001155 [Boothiomyces sp. JEL0866]|nr:hypothetical protein HDV06_001155 [Boothiomyces sp. JEL0866]